MRVRLRLPVQLMLVAINPRKKRVFNLGQRSTSTKRRTEFRALCNLATSLVAANATMP